MMSSFLSYLDVLVSDLDCSVSQLSHFMKVNEPEGGYPDDIRSSMCDLLEEIVSLKTYSNILTFIQEESFENE